MRQHRRKRQSYNKQHPPVTQPRIAQARHLRKNIGHVGCTIRDVRKHCKGEQNQQSIELQNAPRKRQKSPYAACDYLSRALDAGFQFLRRTNRPSHARSIVGNPETSQNIQQNDSPMAVQALFQIVHRFRRHPLG